MPHCVPGFYSKFPGSTWVVPRGPLYTCLYQSNKAILPWYFSTSLFLLRNLWAKDGEDRNTLKISNIGCNYIVINYFIFKCHLKGMLSWVNFVKWHNFLTLQTLFPVCRHTLVPSCLSENTDTIIFLAVSLTSIFLLINVRPLVVSLRPRGKPPSQWHNIGKLYHYLNLPFQLPSPPLLELYIWIMKHSTLFPMPVPVYLPFCLLRMHFLCQSNLFSSFMNKFAFPRLDNGPKPLPHAPTGLYGFHLTIGLTHCSIRHVALVYFCVCFPCLGISLNTDLRYLLKNRFWVSQFCVLTS